MSSVGEIVESMSGEPRRGPRVGDVVHVLWPRATAPEAAIVTAVHSPAHIACTVFPSGSAPFARTSVPHESAAPADGLRWRRPPTEE